LRKVWVELEMIYAQYSGSMVWIRSLKDVKDHNH